MLIKENAVEVNGVIPAINNDVDPAEAVSVSCHSGLEVILCVSRTIANECTILLKDGTNILGTTTHKGHIVIIRTTAVYTVHLLVVRAEIFLGYIVVYTGICTLYLDLTGKSVCFAFADLKAVKCTAPVEFTLGDVIVGKLYCCAVRGDVHSVTTFVINKDRGDKACCLVKLYIVKNIAVSGSGVISGGYRHAEHGCQHHSAKKNRKYFFLCFFTFLYGLWPIKMIQL